MSSPAHGRIVASRFVPHPLLRGPHAQTVVPTLLRPLPPLDIRVERLELPDGDFVDLGWCGATSGRRIAVLVHGLTGGFESKYLRGTAQQLGARGWRCVLLQLRGGGAEPNRLPRIYHHGDTVDLRFLFHELKRREPEARLAAAGWSLGANVLLKALAEEGAQAPVQAAAAACAPLDLKHCAEKLRKGTARVYQQRLLRDLIGIIGRKHAAVPAPHIDIARVQRSRDFFDLDDAWTAPLNGFKDALDYYAQCSSGQYLRAIQVPTLIVNARDDPFMTPDILPTADQLSPQVTLEIARRGGHVGFIGANRYGGWQFWLETHFAEYLDLAVPA
ncbi:MAG TPA: hydrolase [Fontimonas sp.]